MLKIAEMPYNGANSIFLRLLIDKKYALPFRVVDALVFHFLALLPKAFKIIPALSNWEQILYITEPETWTAAAMYQATRWDQLSVL